MKTAIIIAAFSVLESKLLAFRTEVVKEFAV